MPRMGRFFLIPCTASALERMRGCHRFRRRHVHLGSLKILLVFNNPPSISSIGSIWFHSRMVLALVIWWTIPLGRLVELSHSPRLALRCFHLLAHTLDLCLLNLPECLPKLLNGDKLWDQRTIHRVFSQTQRDLSTRWVLSYPTVTLISLLRRP